MIELFIFIMITKISYKIILCKMKSKNYPRTFQIKDNPKKLFLLPPLVKMKSKIYLASLLSFSTILCKSI